MTDEGQSAAAAVVPARFAGELLHLDLLRFVASAGIVLAHSLEFVAPPALRPWWRLRLSGLPLFVDTFFVVSGYIIAHVYAGRIATWRDHAAFLQRRGARLLPLHLVTVICWLLLFGALGAWRIPLHHDVSLTPGCIATATLLLTSFVGCGGMPVAEVSWSVSAEVVMYLLFPVLLLVTGRRGWALALLAGALFGLVLLCRHDATVWQGHLDVGRALPAFTAGVALFAAGPLVDRLRWPRAGLAVAAALLFGSIAVDLPNALLIAAAYALPVFAVAADRRGAGPLVRRIAPLGQLTYSMYLIHGLVIIVALNAVADKLLHLSGVAMAGATVACWLAVLVLSRWSLTYLETPAREAINAMPLVRRRPAAAPAHARG